MEEQRLTMFEKGVARRRLFGRKRDEVRLGWSKLQYEDLHRLSSSQTIIRMIKSKRMIWARHVAHMREMKND
jgi:hypothetical protein